MDSIPFTTVFDDIGTHGWLSLCISSHQMYGLLFRLLRPARFIRQSSLKS